MFQSSNVLSAEFYQQSNGFPRCCPWNFFNKLNLGPLFSHPPHLLPTDRSFVGVLTQTPTPHLHVFVDLFALRRPSINWCVIYQTVACRMWRFEHWAVERSDFRAEDTGGGSLPRPQPAMPDHGQTTFLLDPVNHLARGNNSSTAMSVSSNFLKAPASRKSVVCANAK